MNPDLPALNYAYLEDFLVRLLNTPSPTGFAARAVELGAPDSGRVPADEPASN
jgi:hypothetical protein